MKNLPLVLAAATAVIGLFATAQASQPSEPRSLIVQFADLNTGTNQGAAALYRRMDTAAGVVCGQRKRTGSLIVSETWEACVKNAMQDALAQINRPAVTAYAAAHGVFNGGRSIKVASAN